MNWFWARPPAPPAPTPTLHATPHAEQAGVDFAWKVHNAQESWTARVDGKAALYLATQTAVLVAMFAGFAKDKPLDALDGPNACFAVAGAALSIVAVLVAGCAVIPMMNRTRKLKAEAPDNFIYFGHVRHWKAADLRDRLGRLTAAEELDQLSMQLVALSKRNWAKHTYLRAALVLGALGALTVIGAYLQERIQG